ncbi:hypothetical protein EPN29_13995 [bacterium]|nr:MAG: hypothetical protein EPN29_13995 [bacterium]
MTIFGQSDAQNKRLLELRRLNHAVAVTTAYQRRGSQVDLEAEHSEAVREGYEDGYADGLAKAAIESAALRDAESRRVEVAFAALSKALAEVHEIGTRLRTEVQTTVPKLAFSLLEELLGREAGLAANPGRDAIARALALDGGNQPAIVRMNPADVETLGDVSEISPGRELCLVADPSIKCGGALVEVGRSTLDAQLDSALERVRQVLLASGPESGQ